MNYSDFDKIEQDEWSSTRPTFPTPKGGVLTVVGWIRKNGRSKQYIVQCGECRKDRELHGEGLYVITKVNLTRGGIPCGCSKSPSWGEYQWKVRANRLAEEKGFILKGFAENYRGVGTKLVLFCPLHGEWKTTNILGLKKGKGCPSCGSHKSVSAAATARKGQPAKNKLSKGTIKKERWATQGEWEVISYQNAHSVSVSCTKCSTIYTKSLENLRRGIKCPCFGGKRKITDAHLRHLATSRGMVFLGDNFKANRTKERSLSIRCPKHGVFSTKFGNFVYGATGCPACAGHQPNLSYVHKVSDGFSCVALKYGITKNIDARILYQNRRNTFKVANIGIWEFNNVEDCKQAEAVCKKEFGKGLVCKRDMPDGHTETTHIKNLDRIIEIYENHGGKRINTNEER